MALAPANHRIRMVLTSYAVPNHSPRYSCARNASARPFASPPGWNCAAGISRVVTRLLVIRNALISSAAVVSSRLPLRMRPVGFSSVSPLSPSISGMTTTPVSKPDRPSASFGNTSSAAPISASGEPKPTFSVPSHACTSSGWPRMTCAPLPITTALRHRYATTSTTAIPMASLKPLRNTAPSSSSSTNVTPT